MGAIAPVIWVGVGIAGPFVLAIGTGIELRAVCWLRHCLLRRGRREGYGGQYYRRTELLKEHCCFLPPLAKRDAKDNAQGHLLSALLGAITPT
jgi:hypothetical protein